MNAEIGKLPHKVNLIFSSNTEQSSAVCIALTQEKEVSQAACWEQLLLHGESAGKITPGIVVHEMDNYVPVPQSMPGAPLFY